MMKPILKSAAAHAGHLAVGTAMVWCIGMLMLTDSSFNNNKIQQKSVTSSAEVKVQTEPVKVVPVAEALSVDTVSAVDVYSFMKFKKAAICDYEFAEKGKASKEIEELDPNDFTVELPLDKTEIYEPERNDPVNFTSTRSVADEYYTVYDEISGTTQTLNGHELLCRMVYSEIGESWGEEAIKAQIVAAYSYLRFNDNAGLKPTVGLKTGYTSKMDRLVSSVEGQTVMYNDKIINAVYSASTAGYSTTAKNIWGVEYPYLKCVKSEYDDEDPNWGIEKTYSKEEVKSILEEKFNIELSDNVTKWFVIERVHSGKYIADVTIDGHTELNCTGITLCNLFGVKSNAMDISFKDGTFTFTSYGWGHGVGMSQWGACLYARHGWTYDQILFHYYIDTYLGLSSVNEKAVQRGAKPEEDDSSKTDIPASSSSMGTTTTAPEAALPDETTSTEITTTVPEEQPVVTTAPADDNSAGYSDLI